MNFLRKILSFNVVVIIILHAIIPHMHHGEMTNEEHNFSHNNANGILDIIGLGFQQDATNNLDNYILSEQNSLNNFDFNGFDSFIGSFSMNFNLFPTNDCPTSISQPEIIFNAFITNSNELRGPPSFDSYS